MFETSGALTVLEPAPALVLLILFPLLAAIFARGKHAMRVAIVGSGAVFVLGVMLAIRLALMPGGRALGQLVAPIARIGQLDLSFDLVLGPTGAGCLVLAGAISLGTVLHAAWINQRQRLAWMELLTTGIVIVCIADALPVIALGASLATLGAWGLGQGVSRAGIVSLVAADAALATGTCLLFWCLGGTFGSSGYTPDAQPRFALVSLTNISPSPGKSSLTLTTFEGASVVADDGPPLPGEPLHAPFVVPLDPGTYSFRIQAGGLTDSLVTHVSLTPDHAYALAPFGPTPSLRNIDDQIRVPRPSPLGAVPLQEVLARRTVLGLRAITVASILLFLGALLRLVHVADGAAKVGAALEALVPAVLALRLDVLVTPHASWAIGLAILAALCGAILAGHAATRNEARRALSAKMAADSALVVACVLVAQPSAAFVVMVTAILGASAALSSLDGPGDIRWLGVACAATTGVIPAAGASPGFANALSSAFADAQPLAIAFAVVMAVGIMLGATAAFRVYDTSIGPSRRSFAPAAKGLGTVVAALAMLAGVILGVGTTPFGGHVAPLVMRITPGPVPDSMPALAAAGLFVTTLAAAAGIFTARKSPRWLTSVSAPARAASSLARRIAHLADLTHRSVVVLERDVVEDASLVLGGGAVRLAGAVRGLSEKVSPGRLIDRVGPAVTEKVGLGSDKAFGRFRVVVLVVMVALFAVIVLSSLLLE